MRVREGAEIERAHALDEPLVADVHADELAALLADAVDLGVRIFVIGEDEVFLMGDNREFSFDSRRFGNIEYDSLVGRAFVIIWPLSNFGGL